AGVAGQHPQLLAGGRVPGPYRLVVAGGGQRGSAVHHQRAHPEDRAGVAGQHPQLLAGGRVPGPDRLVVARGGPRGPAGPSAHAPRTAPVWPCSTRSCSPVAASHSATVWSLLAVASSGRPSTTSAHTPLTASLWPCRRRSWSSLAGSQRCTVQSLHAAASA